MTLTYSDQLLGIIDPDTPIYRIFPLWFFEETLRLRQLVLVPPRCWEDPLEILCWRIVLTDQRETPWKQQALESFLCPLYAQCWSRMGESDTLLRAYSRVVLDFHSRRNTCPRDEGVRVRSTPRRLLTSLQHWAADHSDYAFFIGAVQYGSRGEIYQRFADMIRRHGPRRFGRGLYRAQSALWKRHAFAHEAEVRIICIDQEDKPEQPLLRTPIDVAEVFEEVSFDPRLVTFERIEREKIARDLGFSGQFGPSDLYQNVVLEIPLADGWRED